MVTANPLAAHSLTEAFNMPTVCIDAPAKLNLFLEVLGKRQDGFHEIETLIVSVGLSDTLFLTSSLAPEIKVDMRWAIGVGNSSDSNNIPTPRWGPFPPTTDNTVYRVLALLQKEAGIEEGAKVTIIKRIPSESGLGGASSDAASALLAANLLWGLDWPVQSLADIGATVGSDIPFFLADGAALCQGRGEKIIPLPPFPRLWGVLVRPPEGLSTPAVYARCQVDQKPRSAEAILTALKSGQPNKVGKALFNRLTEPASVLSPWIGKLQNEFSLLGLAGDAMTGSGSSYFGICRSRGEARKIASRLRNKSLGYVSVVDISGHTAKPVYST